MPKKAGKRQLKKTGRPPKEFTEEQWRTFDIMCQAGVLEAWICNALGVTEKTLTRIVKDHTGLSFSQYRNQKKDLGNSLVLAKQLELCLKGDRTMLIWWGKQYLGQSDRHEATVTHTQPAKVVYYDNERDTPQLTNGKADDGQAQDSETSLH